MEGDLIAAGDRGGRVFVFADQGDGFTQEAELLPDDVVTGEGFGASIAISNGVIIVGAPLGKDGEGRVVGAVYVFEREGEEWTRRARLLADEGERSAGFGTSVALQGSLLVVGANKADGNEIDTGAAYVFKREEGAWNEEARLIASDGRRSDDFGRSVSTNEDIVFVGAPNRDVAELEQVGGVYLFDKDGSEWYLRGVIIRPDAGRFDNDKLGSSMAISGSRLAVGQRSRRLSILAETASGWNWVGSYVHPRITNFGNVVGMDGDYVVTDRQNSSSGEYVAEVLHVGPGLYATAVEFPEIAPGQELVRQMTVTNVGVGVIEVESVSTGSPDVVATPQAFSLGSGESHTVAVSWIPSSAGTLSTEVVFEHSGINASDSGSVAGSAVDTGLAFIGEGGFSGSGLFTGERYAGAVTVGLRGPTTSVLVTGTSSSDSAFSVSLDTPFEVTGQMEIPIEFAPTVGRSYDAYLYFEHSGSAGRDSVRVTGEARWAPYSAILRTFGTQTVPTNFVNVLFRATDVSGRGLDIPVEIINTEVDYFLVFDDGQEMSPTAPESFYQVTKLDAVPHTLRTVLLLDNSTSVANDLPNIKAAATSVINSLLPNQEVALYVFDDRTTLVQDFTTDRDQLMSAIDGIEVGGPSTSLYSSIIEGVGRWEDRFLLTDVGPGQVDIDIERGFLILLTDGDDTAGSASLAEALAARGERLVYAVGYGTTNDGILSQIGNAGVYTVDTASELPETFATIQDEITNDARSFYWLNYSSPRRANTAWPLRVCLRDNLNTDPDACATTAYSSDGFTSPVRGVFVNRSLSRLYGEDQIDISETGTLLTATTILGVNEPEYEWSSSDPSLVTVEAVEGTNQAVATRVGPPGSTAEITLTDTENNLSVTINGRLVVPNDEAPGPVARVESVYPNPTRGPITFSVTTTAPSVVRVELFDVLGRLVRKSESQPLAQGNHSIVFDGHSISAGSYIAQVKIGEALSLHQITVTR